MYGGYFLCILGMNKFLHVWSWRLWTILIDSKRLFVALKRDLCLGCDIGGAKEPGVIYFPINWGAKEPQNLPNHRVAVALHLLLHCWIFYSQIQSVHELLSYCSFLVSHNPQISSETNCSTSCAVEFIGSTANHLVLHSCTVVEKQVVFVLTGTGTSVLWNQCQFLQVGYHMISHDILFPVFLLHSTWQWFFFL